ncbi:hypothetical protein B0H14DRAFT_3179391 [Mycena olivaceomarginata]|nr:hypothetical protein B0H14DRAFT_3179391 [Mycena olivaceomarginata]
MPTQAGWQGRFLQQNEYPPLVPLSKVPLCEMWVFWESVSGVSLSKSLTVALILNEPSFASAMVLVYITLTRRFRLSAALWRDMKWLGRLRIINRIYTLLSAGFGLLLLILMFREPTTSSKTLENLVAIAMIVYRCLPQKGLSGHVCGCPPFQDFPSELLAKVIQSLPYFDILRAGMVSKLWSSVVREDPIISKLLHKKACFMYIPHFKLWYTSWGIQFGPPVICPPSIDTSSLGCRMNAFPMVDLPAWNDFCDPTQLRQESCLWPKQAREALRHVDPLRFATRLEGFTVSDVVSTLADIWAYGWLTKETNSGISSEEAGCQFNETQHLGNARCYKGLTVRAKRGRLLIIVHLGADIED